MMRRRRLFALAALAFVLAGAAAVLPGGDGDGAPFLADEDQKARARAYLAAHLAPLPEGWRWARIMAEAGPLRVGYAGLEGAQAVILFVPGYTGAIETYAEFYAAWRKKGYGVYAVDLPGQGRSVRRGDDPEKPFTGDFSLYGEAVRHAAADLRERTEAPVVMVAESFGGQAALRAAAEGALGADALVLEAPALAAQTPGYPRGLAIGAARLLTTLGLGGAYAPFQGPWGPDWSLPPGGGVCGDREERVHLQTALFTLEPDLRVAGVTNEWIAGLHRSGAQLARGEGLSELGIPVFAVTAGADRMVLNAPVERLCREGLSDCTQVEVPGASHCFVYEDEAAMGAFFGVVDRAVTRVTGGPSR